MKKKLILISTILIWCCFRCLAQAPNVAYLASDTVTVGVEMTALKPTSAADKAITYAIDPQLPSGFNFDKATGIISGKPGAVSSADYHITATKDTKTGIPFTLRIVARQAPSAVCGCSAKTGANTDCSKTTTRRCLRCGEWWLVFTPIILFVIFLAVFSIYINSQSGQVFSLKLALSESIYPSITEINPKYKELSKEELIKLQTATVGTSPVLTTNIFFPPTITSVKSLMD